MHRGNAFILDLVAHIFSVCWLDRSGVTQQLALLTFSGIWGEFASRLREPSNDSAIRQDGTRQIPPTQDPERGKIDQRGGFCRNSVDFRGFARHTREPRFIAKRH
jgi:hypothetical protein